MLNKLSSGGVQRLAVDDAIELHRRGNEVCIITTESESLSNSFLFEVESANVMIHPILFSSTVNVKGWIALFKLFLNFKPDIIYTHMWFANNVGRVAAFLMGVHKIIAFEHSIYDGVKPKKQFFIDWVLQLISTWVIAVSNPVKHSLIAHGISEKKILVIKNGIDLKRFAVHRDRFDIRRSLGVKDNTFVCMAIGRLHHVKRFDYIIESIRSISEAVLCIVGEGLERKNLEKYAHDAGVSDRVIFLGVRFDIGDLLHAADCLTVASSDREGFGLVILEAMATGTPVISFNFAAANDIITNGIDGLLYSSISELTSCIQQLRVDHVLHAQIIQNGNRTVSKFAIEHHVDSLLAL